MYQFRVSVRKSPIEGNGVFSDEPIMAGSIVWKFDSDHDQVLSVVAYEQLEDRTKAEIRKIGYISPSSNQWVYPPENDPARFTNHSETLNNLTAIFDKDVSQEPFFKANKNIEAGEELTVNYIEFDDSIKSIKPEWMISSL